MRSENQRAKCLAVWQRKSRQILPTNNREIACGFVCIEKIGMSAISMARWSRWIISTELIYRKQLRRIWFSSDWWVFLCRIQFGSDRTKISNEWLIRSVTSWLILDRTSELIRKLDHWTRQLVECDLIFVTTIQFCAKSKCVVLISSVLSQSKWPGEYINNFQCS